MLEMPLDVARRGHAASPRSERTPLLLSVDEVFARLAACRDASVLRDAGPPLAPAQGGTGANGL